MEVWAPGSEVGLGRGRGSRHATSELSSFLLAHIVPGRGQWSVKYVTTGSTTLPMWHYFTDSH